VRSAPDETRPPNGSRRTRPHLWTFARLPGRMERVDSSGQPIERLAGRVDLVIMPAIGEGEEFVEPGGKPRGGFRHEMPFVRLQIIWFVAFVAISAVLTMFPLALIRAFGVSDAVPATAYAFAAAGSLAIYPLAASTAQRYGARYVLQAGFALRAVAIAALSSAFMSPIWGVTVALAGFAILVLAWPLLGVSGTALVAELASGEKGEALGLFNACSSAAGAVGAFLGGWAMELAGYGAVCMVAALLVGLAALCSSSKSTWPGRSATPS